MHLGSYYDGVELHRTGHDRKIHRLYSGDPGAYRRLTCRRYDLPDESCATLGTAANMR